MKYALFDLDGCLSDDRHRLHLIDQTAEHPDDRYDRYNAAADKDAPMNMELVRAICVGHTPVIVTARPERYRAKTEEWLRAYFPGFIPSENVLMRPNDNHDHAPNVKVKLVGDWIDADKVGKVAVVVDDRQDVLEAFKDAFGTSKPHFIRVTYPAPHREPCETVLPKPKHAGAAKVLRAMAETYAQRNKEYGDNFKMVAPLVKALFPDGVPSELVITDQWHLFELILVKLSRFAVSNLTHVDSIHDSAVYGAMIEAIIKGEG